jgi:hypothetical protein
MEVEMKYEKIKNYKDEEFRRLSGVKRFTFHKMIEILEEAEKQKKQEVENQTRYRWKKGC